MDGTIFESWFIWAMAIVVGFPIAAALLGQFLGVFERTQSPIAKSLWYAVNLLLPVTAFFITIRFVIQAPAEGILNRSFLTAALILAILVSVSIFNATFFGSAPKDSWRARTPRLLRDIILVLMVAVGAGVVATQVWDQNVTAFLTALGVGSVVLGFALQETLGNVMLGLSLLTERPFSEGDEILIGEHEGIVEEINWRATRIEVDGDIVIIPHAIAAKETIVNLSKPNEKTPVSVSIGFAYEHPPNQVRAVLREALDSTEEATVLAEKPELGIFVEDFGDSAVIYKVTFLADRAEVKERVIDTFMTLVWYAAQRNNLHIPFPIRTLHNFDGEDQAERKKTAIRQKVHGSKFLSSVIDSDSLDSFVQEASLLHYSSGELVVRQNEQVSKLYIVTSGQALIKIARFNEEDYELFELNRGDFFGEMTLLSGADSPYKVEATSDLQVLALPADDVNRMIEHRPSLAMEIGRIMDIRRQAVRAALSS